MASKSISVAGMKKLLGYHDLSKNESHTLRLHLYIQGDRLAHLSS